MLQERDGLALDPNVILSIHRSAINMLQGTRIDGFLLQIGRDELKDAGKAMKGGDANADVAAVGEEGLDDGF